MRSDKKIEREPATWLIIEHDRDENGFVGYDIFKNGELIQAGQDYDTARAKVARWCRNDDPITEQYVGGREVVFNGAELKQQVNELQTWLREHSE